VGRREDTDAAHDPPLVVGPATTPACLLEPLADEMLATGGRTAQLSVSN
jgi:hypothetical protein